MQASKTFRIILPHTENGLCFLQPAKFLYDRKTCLITLPRKYALVLEGTLKQGCFNIDISHESCRINWKIFFFIEGAFHFAFSNNSLCKINFLITVDQETVVLWFAAVILAENFLDIKFLNETVFFCYYLTKYFSK